MMKRHLLSLRGRLDREIYPESKLTIKAKAGETYQYIDENTGETPQHIKPQRIKNHLVINDLDNGSQIVIEDFWKNCESGANRCEFILDNTATGEKITIDPSIASLKSLKLPEIDASADTSNALVSWGPYKGVDLRSSILHSGATAIVTYALATQSKVISISSPIETHNTTEATAPSTNSAALKIDMIAVEDAGKGDGTIRVSGVTEPNATLNIQFAPRGALIKTEQLNVTANEKGIFTGESTLNQGDGPICLKITDTQLRSADYDKLYDDVVPAKPFQLDLVEQNTPYLLNENGTVSITGHGEPGASVQFTFPSGEMVEALINENGEFTLRTQHAQFTGNVSATITDLGKNMIHIPVPGLVSTPSPPLIMLMDTGREDGKFFILGFAEANSTVKIVFPDQSDRIKNGETIEMVAASNTTYANFFDYSGFLFAETKWVKGDGTFTASAINAKGESQAITYTFDDTILPKPLSNVKTLLSATEPGVIEFSGTAEPFSTVTIRIGDTLVSTYTDALGVFQGKTPALPNGSIADMEWTLTDIGNNSRQSNKSVGVEWADTDAASNPHVSIQGGLPDVGLLNVLNNSALLAIHFDEECILDASKLVVEGGELTEVMHSTLSVAYVFKAFANYEGSGLIQVPNGCVLDFANNPNADELDENNRFSFHVDTIAPCLHLEASQTTLQANEQTYITLRSSEPIGNSLSLDDFIVSGGVLSHLEQDPTDLLEWHMLFTANSTPNTEWVVSLGSITVYDLAGNFNQDGLDANNSIYFNVIL